MDQEQELTIGEAYTAGYLFGRKEFARDLELLQAAELEGEYQAMLAEKRALPAPCGPEAHWVLCLKCGRKAPIIQFGEGQMAACCGGILYNEGAITQADLELNTTGGRWK